ncbi:MAG: zf-HC2 domain-containing protein [Thermodesulfobacteriota bacterium]
MMDCREVRECLSDYRDGSLPETVGDGISHHLLECAGCAEVDRSLGTVREQLRKLPPVPAPPELFGRIRDAVAGESRPVRSAFSRWMVPLEAAAALLLFASVYWYWSGSAPVTAPGTPPAPAEIASAALTESPSPSPARDVPQSPAITPAPPRIARTAPRAVAAIPPTEPERERGSISTLPEDTPDPKERVYTIADLPAVPVLRASTNFRRIAPVVPRETEAETETRTAANGASNPSRIHTPFPYGRTVSLEVAQEEREDAGNRIGETALRLGGTVEGTDRVVPDGIVAVRVLLPERTARTFIEELARIGEIPPDGMPKRSVLPAGPAPGTVAYSVRLRAK